MYYLDISHPGFEIRLMYSMPHGIYIVFEHVAAVLEIQPSVQRAGPAVD
jgi:hypothetical protein